ncbi:hypothetical protein ABIB75_008044 [Bradyrhizobium sp. GM2.2]|uniref:hypothetical protein n=1 Tax=Bradyrhizobium sp. GM2.2 TaxID=3156358 RepID=UPI003391A24E
MTNEHRCRTPAYRAAVARLEQARAPAAEQWPEPPPSVVITSAADRRAFEGCFEQAEGFEGQPLYRTIVDANGTVHPDGAWLNLLKPDRLRIALAVVRGDTERWGGKRARQRLEGDLTARIVAAERYGAQCARAIEVSGVEAAKDAAHIEAKKIHYLLYRIRQHAPLTVSGMLILARGMMLFEKVQKSNYCGGGQGRGLLLGRELASAVLRVAGIAA